MTKKKEIRVSLRLTLGLIVLFFLFGIVVGIALGVDAGQRKLFEGMAIALSGSNIDVSVDINETVMVDTMVEILTPLFNYTPQEEG